MVDKEIEVWYANYLWSLSCFFFLFISFGTDLFCLLQQNPSKIISLDDLYAAKITHGSEDKMVWSLSKKSWCPCKYKALRMWGRWQKFPMAKYMVLTMDNLGRRGIITNWCCMWKSKGESVDHRFLHYEIARELWSLVDLGYAKICNWLIGSLEWTLWKTLYHWTLEGYSVVFDVDSVEVKECMHLWRQWAISSEAEILIFMFPAWVAS